MERGFFAGAALFTLLWCGCSDPNQGICGDAQPDLVLDQVSWDAAAQKVYLGLHRGLSFCASEDELDQVPKVELLMISLGLEERTLAVWREPRSAFGVLAPAAGAVPIFTGTLDPARCSLTCEVILHGEGIELRVAADPEFRSEYAEAYPAGALRLDVVRPEREPQRYLIEDPPLAL